MFPSTLFFILEATVPLRSEYGKTCILENPTSLLNSSVSSKSSSVSPGKPTIISVERDIPGLNFLILLTISINSSRVYLLFINFNTLLLPAWRGICKWDTNLLLFFNISSIPSSSSTISTDESLILSSPSILDKPFITSQSLLPSSLYCPVCIPASTISLWPELTKSRASLIHLS